MTSCCGERAHQCRVHRPASTILSRYATQDYELSKDTIRQFVSLPNASPSREFLNIPNELLLMVCDHLPLASKCALALVNKELKHKLSDLYWPKLTSHTAGKSKLEFLELLQQDIPEKAVCSEHKILHAALEQPTNGNDGYTFDNFYHISSAQIKSFLEGRICPTLFRCKTTLLFQFPGGREAGNVTYRLKSPSNATIGPVIQREYRLPILRAGLTVNAAEEQGLNIELCSHATLKWLMRDHTHGSYYDREILADWTGPVRDWGITLIGERPYRLKHYYECKKCGAFATSYDLDPNYDGHTTCVFGTSLVGPSRSDRRWDALEMMKDCFQGLLLGSETLERLN
ncbi:hypothetical protein BT63DRAFT_454143 [Microthyrium microscopicum]|uniref:F-box domain-containing protein n=1 Tax=Microthyrium microscopicum TaxID=703497 RepID=A0A6A6UEU8_9PEZI|nr:hypothetical protein BT63DRAFT_454143 [Microthyrium microscopicum]